MMRLIVLLVFTFVLSFNYSEAQISQEIKNTMDAFPSKVGSTSSFASKINKEYNNDVDKVAAIYYWMAKNITFDTKEHFSDKKKITYSFRYKTQEEKQRKIEKVNREIAEEVFKARKATAKEFSFLFQKICVNAGIECVYIEGTSKSELKDIGRKAGRVNHYWNAVKLSGKWELIDVCWGAGEIYEEFETFVEAYNEAYFLIKPELFYLNHFPKDTEWLFMDKTKEDFGLLSLFYKSYLSSNLFLENKDAVISSVDDTTLKIVFSFRDKTKQTQGYMFSYAFDRESSKKAIIPKTDNGQLVLNISLVGKKYDYLTVYVDYKPFASFKIKMNSF